MTIRQSACILVVFAAAAMAADPGTISGTIVTAAGKGVPVPTAPVVAKNLATQATYKATDDAGVQHLVKQ